MALNRNLETYENVGRVHKSGWEAGSDELWIGFSDVKRARERALEDDRHGPDIGPPTPARRVAFVDVIAPNSSNRPVTECSRTRRTEFYPPLGQLKNATVAKIYS